MAAMLLAIGLDPELLEPVADGLELVPERSVGSRDTRAQRAQLATKARQLALEGMLVLCGAPMDGVAGNLARLAVRHRCIELRQIVHALGDPLLELADEPCLMTDSRCAAGFDEPAGCRRPRPDSAPPHPPRGPRRAAPGPGAGRYDGS